MKLTQHSGDWAEADGTRKLLRRMTDGVRGTAGSARKSRITLSWQALVTWVPNQVFENSESWGEISQETSPLRFCC